MGRRGWTGHLTSGASLPCFLWCIGCPVGRCGQCRVSLMWCQPNAHCGKPSNSSESGRDKPAAFSLLSCPSENIPFYSSISRAEACPEKAQQGGGLGPGSEPTSKGTHDLPALAEETVDCQKTPGRPCGSRPLLGLVRTLLPRSELI